MTGDLYWRDQAACRDANPELFRPEQPRLAAATIIRRFCRGCPVAEQCRVDAEAGRERGVWGARFFTGWPNPRGLAAEQLDGGLGPASGGTVAPRGACRACGRDLALRGDGRVRRHDGDDQQSCPGEGYLPRSEAS